MKKPNKASLQSLLFSTALVLFTVFLTFNPPIDPDFGWHYRYGEYMVKNKALLDQNIHSYVTEGYEWTSFYWVPQIISYLLFSNLPHVLASLILSTAFSIVLVCLLNKTPMNSLGKVLAVVLTGTYMGTYLITVRPMLYSSILILLLMYILEYKEKLLPFLPVLFLIWANLHADWLFGLGIVGLYFLVGLIIKVRAKDLRLKDVLKAGLIVGACMLATLATPHGVHLWKTLVIEGQMANKGFITEWQAPTIGSTLDDKVMYVLLVGTGGLILATTFMERKAKKPWFIATVVVFYLLANRSVYFYRILILISTTTIGVCWGRFLGTLYRFLQKDQLKKYARLVAHVTLCLIALMAVHNFIKKFVYNQKIAYWSTNENYPYEAVQLIKAAPEEFEGNMFNSYEWGGYLIWHLPEHKTFIDGRLASWGVDRDPQLIYEYRKSKKNIESFEELLTKYDIAWILVRADSPHGKIISEHPERFTVLYSSDAETVARPITL